MKRLFAIGDIHGCFDPFREMVEDKIQLRKDDKLVLLGDYIDRGKNSKAVIDYIIDLQKKGFDIIPLTGNHEVMLLDSIGNENENIRWMRNGAAETLKSFGINSIDDLPDNYIRFFKDLPYYYSFKDFLFVHAGFNDEIPDPFQDKYSMIWIRRSADSNSIATYSNPLLADKTIVHGHTPLTVKECQNQLDQNSRVICIDTGCVYKSKIGFGKLTAVELYSKELFSV